MLALRGSSMARFATGSRLLSWSRPALGAAAVRSRSSVRTEALTKVQLAEQLAERMPSLSKKDAVAAVDITLAVIMEKVASGDKVNIAGFGTFEPRDRSARKGRNPQTGEELQIAATRVPAFSAAKAFKDAVKASMNSTA